MYREFIEWLDATPLSQTFKELAWVVPTVQSVHILGIAVVLGGGVILSLRLIGLNARHIEIPALAQRLLPSMWWAMLVLLISGAVLIITEPTRTLANPFFFAKVACIAVLLPLTRYFDVSVRKQPARWTGGSAPSFAVRPAAVIAVLLLLTIIYCGRWIAYA